MSNIEQNLQKILSSRYGKDVRQSIHDSIHDCYEDGKAGAVDLVARERIDNLVANVPEGSTKDSELVDIRVGYNGTRYTSAGESIRRQIGDLHGDVDLLNQGGLDLKDELISSKVSEWLIEHPEATTTVQDGCITEEKLSDNLRAGLSPLLQPIGYTIPQSNSENYGRWTLERYKESIDAVADFGYSDIYILNEEQYTGIWTWRLDINDFITAIQYAIGKFEHVSIRLYCNATYNSNRDSAWETWHKSSVQSIVSQLQQNDISIYRFGDFNENPYILTTYPTLVQDVSAIVSPYSSFGITFAGFGSALNTDDTIFNLCNWIGVNLYPAVGLCNEIKNMNLKVSQMANTMASYCYSGFLRALKAKFNVGAVILSEIGTTKYYVGLDYPGYTQYSAEQERTCAKDETGQLGATYFEAALYALNGIGFDEICCWYNSGEKAPMKTMLERWLI